jgi:hypothetical protein
MYSRRLSLEATYSDWWASSLRMTLQNYISSLQEAEGHNDSLIVKIILGHELPKLLQPFKSIDFLPENRNVIDFALVS